MNLKKISITLFCITIGLFTIGTFFDWQIDTALAGHFYFYGKFFETFGLIPITVVRVFCMTYLIRVIVFDNKPLLYVLRAIIGYFSTKFATNGLLTIYLMLGYWITGSYSAPSTFVVIGAYIIGLVITLGITYLLFKRDLELLKPLFTRVIMVFLITILINHEVEFIKAHVGRARYYTVANGDGVYTPWYVINGLTDSNDFMSFISGHTTTAFMAFLPVFFTLPSQVKLRNNLYIFGVVFGVLVAFSRMVLSQHYLTDVTGSFIVSAITIFIMCMLFKIKLDASDLKQEL